MKQHRCSQCGRPAEARLQGVPHISHICRQFPICKPQGGVPVEASTRDDLRVAPAAEAAGAPPCDSPAPHSPESWALHWETLGYRKLTPAFVLAIQTTALADFDQHFKEIGEAYAEAASAVVELRRKLAEEVHHHGATNRARMQLVTELRWAEARRRPVDLSELEAIRRWVESPNVCHTELSLARFRMLIQIIDELTTHQTGSH
jgi:hypothetical protein